jgi:hypothetical protein
MPAVELHRYARGGWTSLPLQFQIDLNPLNSDLRHTMVFFVYQAPAEELLPTIGPNGDVYERVHCTASGYPFKA